MERCIYVWLNRFGHAGEAAVSIELMQINSWKVIEPKHHH